MPSDAASVGGRGRRDGGREKERGKGVDGVVSYFVSSLTYTLYFFVGCWFCQKNGFL